MARGLTSAVNTELATDKLNPVTLVYLGVGSGSRYTDHYKDLTYDSNTFTASSLFLKASSVTESSEVEITNIQLTFTGADQTIISLFLNNNYMSKDVEVYKGFLNDSQALIADPVTLFKGKIESFSVDEEINNSTVNISVLRIGQTLKECKVEKQIQTLNKYILVVMLVLIMLHNISQKLNGVGIDARYCRTF